MAGFGSSSSSGGGGGGFGGFGTGGGGGSGTEGFGSNSNNINQLPGPGGSFGAGFGAGSASGVSQQSTSFGQPPLQQQQMTFGQSHQSSSPASFGFGSISAPPVPFQQQQQQQQQPPPFGSQQSSNPIVPSPFINFNSSSTGSVPSSANPGLTFGTSPNVVVGSGNMNSNDNSSPTAPFGAVRGSGFGGGHLPSNATTKTNSGFGGNSSGSSNPFGHSSSGSGATAGFVSSGGFGGVSNNASGGPGGSTGVTFGTSPSSSNTSRGGFGIHAQLSRSSLSASASPWTPGGPAPPGSGFGGSNNSSSDGSRKPTGGFSTGNSQRGHSINPFAATPSTSQQSRDLGGDSSDDDMDAGRFGGRGNSSNKEWRRGPTQNKQDGGGMASSDDEVDEDGGGGSSNKDAIRANKAAEEEIKKKIAEKKRRLLEAQERKKRKEQESRTNSSGTMSPPRSSSPPPFPQQHFPSSSSSSHRRGQDGEMDDLARRNTARFERKQQRSTAVSSRSSSPVVAVAESERADLDNAVTLVGTCQNMCPDDELARREEENDIQALEVVMPNVIHPPDWTLRETAVKRFRRSAADYKLDVPEWVRPPDVLERTVSYLEEWVMERDRQGIDPRFRQTNIPPPPLDVYQFIWDRTRMIRKDFTLQNYVGTNGNCDARAVRCHERIARWHALCEHQLSHLEDFVKAQSSQNITELGQTLKTLNELYDDSLNRSTVEVADAEGRETRNVSELYRYREGCHCETVEGQNPIDYDGTPLNNKPDNPKAALRLIGTSPSVLQLPAHGTAEPEMRALYILLTVNNEGGMEVLKYAARLFKERPAVYHSPLVQLALKIFKAIRDDNYASFFTIIRNPSTPYLFCCILFSQYVTRMRKTAIQTMAATYGGRTADGQTGHDAYQLSRLVKLLCFEDAEEARDACMFYNITVKQKQFSDGSVHDIILWKATRFQEPTDPTKGTLLSLYPRKMTRTIERKLEGATRLAICRGEVSGDGAALSTPQRRVTDSSATAVVPFTSDDARFNAQSLIDKQSKDMELLQKQQVEREEENRKKKIEKDLEEKKCQEEEQRKREMEKKRLDELEVRRKEQEALEQKRADDERRRKQEEMERERARREGEAAEEKARIEAEEARARLAAEELRKQQEIEEKNRRDEAERLVRERDRKLAEERKRRELEERRCQEEEEARLREAARLEMEARLKREAEDRRKTQDWQREISCASRLVAWLRWKRTMSLQMERMYKSRRSLDRLDDPSKFDSLASFEDVFQDSVRRELMTIEMPAESMVTPRDVLELLLQENVRKFSVASMAMHEVQRSMDQKYFNPRSAKQKMTLLLKIAVIIPVEINVADESWAGLITKWVESRVAVGLTDILIHQNCEVRAVVVNGSNSQISNDCDVALFVIPPNWIYPDSESRLYKFRSQRIRDAIPRIALVLADLEDVDECYRKSCYSYIADELGGERDVNLTILTPSAQRPDAYDSAFKVAMRRCVEIHLDNNYVFLSRIPIIDLACKTMIAALQICVPSSGIDGDDILCLECARESLSLLVREISNCAIQNKENWSHLPQTDFLSEDGVVPSFFSDKDSFPRTWLNCLNFEFLTESFYPLIDALGGHFEYVFRRLVADAPTMVLDDCVTLYANGMFRSCLEKSIAWTGESQKSKEGYLYLPFNMAEDIMEVVTRAIKGDTRFQIQKRTIQGVNVQHTHPSIAEMDQRNTAGISELPAAANDSSPESRTKKRSRFGSYGDGKLSTYDENDSILVKKRSRKSRLSVELQESRAFTNRLDDLLNGETVDLAVGNSTLRHLLGRQPP